MVPNHDRLPEDRMGMRWNRPTTKTVVFGLRLQRLESQSIVQKWSLGESFDLMRGCEN